MKNLGNAPPCRVNKIYEEHYGNGSLERWAVNWARPRAEIIASIIDTKKGTLLDVAGYRGILKTLLPSQLKYTLIDLVDSNRFDLVVKDLNDGVLPFKDKSFDIIVAVDIFEHIECPLVLIREIRRCLKAGGYAILSLSTRLTDGHTTLINHSTVPNFLKGFKIEKKIGIVGGLVPLMRVPLFMASEIFYKVVKKC